MTEDNISRALFMLSMAASVGIGGSILPYQLRKSEKSYKTCLLPTCNELTNHNGGYCCADHCKEHRKIKGRV